MLRERLDHDPGDFLLAVRQLGDQHGDLITGALGEQNRDRRVEHEGDLVEGLERGAPDSLLETADGFLGYACELSEALLGQAEPMPVITNSSAQGLIGHHRRTPMEDAARGGEGVEGVIGSELAYAELVLIIPGDFEASNGLWTWQGTRHELHRLD